MKQGRNFASLALLALFLLLLAAAILLHWKVAALEAEQAALRTLDFATIAENMERNREITQMLYGRFGLYRYESRAFTGAGICGFICMCDGFERLRKRIYKEDRP